MGAAGRLAVLDWGGGEAFDAVRAETALREDGALLVRGVLAPEEIAFARTQLRSRLTSGGERIQLGRTQPNAAVLAPEIGWLVSHPSIVSIFKVLLGERLCFTGHCDIHMNMLSGWHKDSGESVGGYFRGDYFAAEECRVFKAAVYLQDAGPNDGLTIALGSHRRRGHEGERLHVPSKAGDVVFFDVRLSHVGQLPDPVERGIKAFVRPFRSASRNEPAWATMVREAYWKTIGRRDRLSIFFTYGADNVFTQDFSRANMRRQAEQTGKEVASFSPELTASLMQSQVRLADLDHAA
jgi:hypothetical protein